MRTTNGTNEHENLSTEYTKETESLADVGHCSKKFVDNM